jgi:THO complex subunit 2
MASVKMDPTSYNFLTKEVCKSWPSSGRAEVLKQFNDSYRASKKDISNGYQLRKIMHELLWRYLGEYVSTDDMNQWLGSASQDCPEIQTLCVDVLLVVDAECSLTDNDDHKMRLGKFTSLISKLGAEKTLQERLDLETGTLEKAGIIPNQKQFQQKYIKTKTRLFYKQQKFNLLREEIEGYSKLATELFENNHPEETLEHVKSLIGCFNIDPNRVLDICLEYLEHSIVSPSAAKKLISCYLRLCDSTTLTHLLGFKFQFYEKTKTPESLYKTAGLLLQSGMVELDDLYPHLSPSDAEIREHHKKTMMAAGELKKRLSVVQLGDKKKEDINIDAMMVQEGNQKFGLARALVTLGNWETAHEIIERYPQFCAVSDPSMAKAITKRCHQIVEPLFRKVAAKRIGNGKPVEILIDEKFLVKEFSDIETKLMPIVTTLGPMLSVDPLLFTKILRIAKSFFRTYKTETSEEWRTNNRGTIASLLCIIEEVLLPSLTMMDCPVVQSEELWQIFKNMNYELRYRLYGHWKNLSCTLHPKLIVAHAKSVDRTKYVLKRLTKDTVKQSGRQLGKISHANPGALFDTILVQIQRYDNLIGPVVDTLKYLTSVSYDILIYCVIEALANPEKETMKTDGTTISDWLQSLANFCGTVCKKYSIDLIGLIQYVANKLQSGSSLDLLLLKEVVQKMSGIEANVEVTDDQLFALSGGEILKTEGGYFGQIRNVKKPSMRFGNISSVFYKILNRLREVLIEHGIALPLCLLMSTHRAHIVFEEGVGKHLKLVGKLTDQCHDTLYQFGGFLSANLSMEEYMKQVPPIEELIEKYGTPWDVAFFISRQMYNQQIQDQYQIKVTDQKIDDQEVKVSFCDSK